MRLYMLCIVLLVSSLLCESKKRQKQSRMQESNRRSNSDSNLSSSSEWRTLSGSRDHLDHRRNSREEIIKRHKQPNVNLHDDSRILEEQRKELLRSTMRRMFGFEHMDAPRVPKESDFDVKPSKRGRESFSRKQISRSLFSSLRRDSVSSHHFLPNPPDFMLELYRSYSEDKSLMLINAQNQGNTVRSFFSIAGESPENLRNKGKPMIIVPYTRSQNDGTNAGNRFGVNSRHNQMRVFAFNVTSIPTTETIVAAELRLDGLRSRALRNQASGLNPSSNNTDSGWTAVLSVYQVSNQEGNETRNVYQRLGDLVTLRPNNSFSWIDNSIAHLASYAREPDRILIVKFNYDRTDSFFRKKRTTFRPIPSYSTLNSISSRDSSPNLPSYFVVLADRSKRNSGERRASSDSVKLTPILIVYCNDTTTKTTPSSSPLVSNEILSSMLQQNVNASTRRSRFRRSSNERIFGSSAASSSDESNNELPGESGRHGNLSSNTRDNGQTELHDNDRSERRVIQSLKERKRKGKKKGKSRKCRKRTRKGKKSRSCNRKSTSQDPQTSLNRAQLTCSKQSLNVDFQDMGWADWIISPKSFEAYYCSGLCAFNTIKKANPSNHAIIQAFINAFEINAEVPAPCCVPDKLLSLTVLFFDKNSNVVLKVFPNMSVETCACR